MNSYIEITAINVKPCLDPDDYVRETKGAGEVVIPDGLERKRDKKFDRKDMQKFVKPLVDEL